MNVEIVTPAGRKRYLEILYKHLKAQKKDFNNWTLWVNTSNQEDLDYCQLLEKENNWIKTIYNQSQDKTPLAIHQFFKYTCDSNTVYIRLDDDIVWIEKDFIKNLANFRMNNPEYFLVYGNIINNSIIDHIHQRMGNLKLSKIIGYGVLDHYGWANPEIAKEKHESFQQDIRNNNIEKFKFSRWILNLYERVSINSISWIGDEFAKFDGKVGIDEEQWLSVDKPIQLKKPNMIYGGAVCAHFAFKTQRNILDKYHHILDEYKRLAD